jgi:acetyl esterase/lipase
MMRIFSVDIWEGFGYEDGRGGWRPSLDCYLSDTVALPSGAVRPGVVVLPGSGYHDCSHREAEQLALKFNALGYHAFVLWYTCANARDVPIYPQPLRDCCRALTLLRQHAASWRLNPKRLGLLGFSSGSHCALSEALYYDHKDADVPGVDKSLCRPDLLALCYPVVTFAEYAHQGSIDMLLGRNPSPQLLDMMSLERHIRSDLCPVFLFHTFVDEAVPVGNTMNLALALRKAGVPAELHIFPEGGHGISLATEETAVGNPDRINPHTAQWWPLCARWFRHYWKSF